MDTIYYIGQFTDFAGEVHNFVIAGVPVEFNNGLLYEDEIDESFGDYPICDMYKGIAIGISICNPLDDFDIWRGKKQAEGRALKRKDRIISFSKGGMCTSEAISFFVEQTAKSLCSNPGLFIRGYNGAMKKYNESKN